MLDSMQDIYGCITFACSFICIMHKLRNPSIVRGLRFVFFVLGLYCNGNVAPFVTADGRKGRRQQYSGRRNATDLSRKSNPASND